jgi:hypothetical protein
MADQGGAKEGAEEVFSKHEAGIYVKKVTL